MMSGGKLASQTQLLYSPPLGPVSKNSEQTLAVQERALSFTGEDFDVYQLPSNEPYCSVRGAMLHLPGKDKMRLRNNDGTVLCELDRKLVALKPTYDIYRGNGQEKLGWIEKKALALTDTFEVFLEGNGGLGPFKPPPAYRLEGDFIDRTFVMKDGANQVVAKVVKDGWIQFDQFNHYQIRIAPGMDATLVVACCCAIDEEFDEEHQAERKKKQEEEEDKGGWF